jgi:hypothetical protein
MLAQSRTLLTAAALAGVAIMGVLGWWAGHLLDSTKSASGAEVAAVESDADGMKLRSADLQADWSDRENPHATSFGTWSYNQNRKPLSAIENWDGLPNQGIRGWGPEVSPAEDFLFICRASPAANLDVLGTAELGDVLMHTASTGRGNGQVAWTSPWTGSVSVTGALWPTRTLGRANIWRLQLVTRGAATTLASGELPEDGTVTRRKPSAFALPAVSIHEDDVLELEVMRSATTTPWGDFAAITWTITQNAPSAMTRAAPLPAAGAQVQPAVAPMGGTLMMVMLVVMVLLGLIALALAVIVILLLKRHVPTGRVNEGR